MRFKYKANDTKNFKNNHIYELVTIDKDRVFSDGNVFMIDENNKLVDIYYDDINKFNDDFEYVNDEWIDEVVTEWYADGNVFKRIEEYSNVKHHIFKEIEDKYNKNIIKI